MSWQAVRAVLDITDVRPTAKLVLFALAARADTDGRAWPSISRLCADTGLSARAVQYALRTLAEGGHISVTNRPGRSLWITVTAAPLADPPRHDVHQPRHDVPVTAARRAPRSRKEYVKEYAAPTPTPSGVGSASNGNGSIAARTAAVQRRRAEAANCRRCDDEGVTLDGDGWCKH